MAKKIKRIFNPKFQTTLAKAECAKRLTSEYKNILRNSGKWDTSLVGWSLAFFSNRKGLPIAQSDWGSFSFKYKIKLESNSCGTIIECLHFPFSITAILIPSCLSLIGFIGCIIAIIDFDKNLLIISSMWFVGFLITCVFLEYYARNPLVRYLLLFLDCKPFDGDTTNAS